VRLVCGRRITPRTSNTCYNTTFEEMEAMLGKSRISEYASPFTSIDSWDELLDYPREGTLVVRTHHNWLARLATTRVCHNMDAFVAVILPPEPCWGCCGALLVKYLSMQKPLRVVLIL
jgi:hypothetical protein